MIKFHLNTLPFFTSVLHVAKLKLGELPLGYSSRKTVKMRAKKDNDNSFTNNHSQLRAHTHTHTSCSTALCMNTSKLSGIRSNKDLKYGDFIRLYRLFSEGKKTWLLFCQPDILLIMLSKEPHQTPLQQTAPH